MQNHARSVLACDFFVTVTARFKLLFMFVVLDVGTRRILHWNVTEHPTAEWTAQQFRMVVSGQSLHRFVVHDHDSVYYVGVDRTLESMVTGGSAFGLDAVSGVVRFLDENSIGFKIGRATVPTVPSAILVDVEVGSSEKIRPTADCGYRAA